MTVGSCCGSRVRLLIALSLSLWPLTSGCGDPETPHDAGNEPDAASGACVPDRGAWASSIEPSVQRHCGSCHGETPDFGAPYSLTDLDFLLTPFAGGQRPVDRMAALVHAGQMPPPALARMPDETARAIVEWASCGELTVTEQTGLTSTASPWLAPATGPAGLETLDLTASEFVVSPTTRDLYRCFVFDVPTTEDRFIRRFEMIFDRTEVLHHLVLLRDTDGTAPDEDYDCLGAMPTGSQYLYAWAPGQGAVEFPEGGLRLRPGERYVMQIHYNNGVGLPDVSDSSGVRLFLAPPEGDEYGMLAIGPVSFEIPARSSQTAGSYCTVREESRMIAGMPHMHEVGTSFHEHIESGAGGRRRDLIDIENWDFDTQLFYALPATLEPGDRIYTECTWDNPGSERVTTGPRTDDEMCFNFAYITPPPTALFCDEGDGPPSDVPYAPGTCAPSGASADVPVQTLPWREGIASSPLAGGAVPDGHWTLTGGEILVSALTTPLGTVDLARTFTLARGQATTSGGTFSFDAATHVFIQATAGASFGRPGAISFAGEWSPTTSPATVARTCPDVGTTSFEYELSGDVLRVRFGPSTALPGAQLWSSFELTRMP